MKKKLNIKNLVKLIALMVLLIIVGVDFIKLLVIPSISFTWFGFWIEISLLILIEILYEDLFERE